MLPCFYPCSGGCLCVSVCQVGTRQERSTQRGFCCPLLKKRTLSLAAGHMAFCFLALAPLAMRQPWAVHRRTLCKSWRGVICIGSFMSLSIVLNNISLLDISLSLNQIIRCGAAARSGRVKRVCVLQHSDVFILCVGHLPSLSSPLTCSSSIPVVTCALAVLVERTLPTHRELTALLVLTFGVVLAVWQGALAGKPYAICFCIASTVANAAMMTFSGKLLRCVEQ